MSIRVLRIDQQKLPEAYEIRTSVFVDEQKVPSHMEIDEFENSAHHYLAYFDNNTPVGTARWRKTEKGFKLERFAVLKEFRKKAVGSALLEKVLTDVLSHRKNGEPVYLHAQITAMPLYEKFGFLKEGEMFEECGIRHYKMTLLS